MYKEKWYCSIWFIAVMFFMAVALSSETSETSTPKNDTVATTSPPEKHLEATTQTNTPESEKSTSFESEFFFIFGILFLYKKHKSAIGHIRAMEAKEERVRQRLLEIEDAFKNSEHELQDRQREILHQCRREAESLKKDAELEIKARYASFSVEEKKLLAKSSTLSSEADLLKKAIKDLHQELKLLSETALTEHYNFSAYDSKTSEECQNKLAILRLEIADLIKTGKAVQAFGSGSKKNISDNSKQILRCFNAEFTNFMSTLNFKNVDTVRSKISKSFESLNKIFEIDGVRLDSKILELKLEELGFVHQFEVLKNQEKEIQKAIKAQMVEEEKVRRDIEKQKAIIEKDQKHYQTEIKKLTIYLQKAVDEVERQLYVDKIQKIETNLQELEVKKADADRREQNARAGHVYIISNIGSFGEDVFKIGMTRRLEPMDRIKELGDASVPFEFDVHAMIFSEDAPALESSLHKHFEKNSINRVNPRKEFFKVSLDKIEEYVKANYSQTTRFTKIPIASEYRQSMEIVEKEASGQV